MSTPKLDYTDNAVPFTHGKVGLRAHRANSSFDNFNVKHTAAEPMDAGADSGPMPVDASVDAASGGDAEGGGSSPAGIAGAPQAGGENAGSAGLALKGGGSPSNGSCGCRTAGASRTLSDADALVVLGLASSFAARRRRDR